MNFVDRFCRKIYPNSEKASCQSKCLLIIIMEIENRYVFNVVIWYMMDKRSTN